MNGFLLFFLSIFTVVQLNCENFFDCKHDSLKQDTEFLPTGFHHWTPKRYWHKTIHLAQEIVACGEQNNQWFMPDVIGLCEVENDSCMQTLVRRSPLRTARYEYVMTHSPDVRGINVALLYSPFSFRLISSASIPINVPKNVRPTRDILYVSGSVSTQDTLHFFVVHAPSKRGGELQTLPLRKKVCSILAQKIDSLQGINKDTKIFVLGDFNDNGKSEAFEPLKHCLITDISEGVKGQNGAKGTYKFRGEWTSLDHIFVSNSILKSLLKCVINDAPFLLTADLKYGGVQPLRCYIGAKYTNGFSDHLPLVAFFDW